jgi:hypothetical protein
METKSGYTLVNAEKVDRALNGILKADSTRVGGVGKGAYQESGVWKRDGVELNEEEIAKLEFDLLAEYDKHSGFIKRGSDKVENGSFYDFKGRQPRKEPKVNFIYRFGNKVVKVPDGKELPGEIKAQKILKEAHREQIEEQEEAKEAKRVKRAKR